MAAGESLESIGENHPEARDACIAVLSKRLEKYPANEDHLNAFLIGNITSLQAVESIDLI